MEKCFFRKTNTCRFSISNWLKSTKMAVKNKKAVAQQDKPQAKNVKPQSKDEEDELEEKSDEELGADSDLGEADADMKDSDQEAGGSEDEDDEAEEEAKEGDKPAQAKKRAADDGEESSEVDEADEELAMKTSVFVGHLKFDPDKKVLEEFFAKCGEILSIRVINKRGYAFVRFADASSVDEALKLDKQEIDGRAVHIERVKSKKSDSKKRKNLKRKLNEEDGDAGPRETKVSRRGPNRPKGKGKGVQKTPQKGNPNKKQNKPKPGQFVKAV